MFNAITSLPSWLFVSCGGAAIAVLGYMVSTMLLDRSSARSTLRQLDEYAIDDQREQVLLAPMRHRIFKPVVSHFAQLTQRLNPPEYVEAVKAKHVQAGISGAEKVERFLAIRILGFVFIPLWVLLILVVNPLAFTGLVKWITVAIGVTAGAILPSARLEAKISERHTNIQRQLPDVLDLLVISVEAGLGFEQAVDRVVTNVPGDLSAEFARMIGETQAGASRSESLRAMQERVDIPEIRSFVLAMIQADQYGVSVAQVLRAQADEMRIKRRQQAQEKAQKAPIKMMLPMVFCIFPALFVVVIGPAIINISQSF